MDKISPFITSISSKFNENKTILVTVVICLLIIIFLCICVFSKDEKSDKIERKDCPKIENCNSYFSCLCCLILVFVYLVVQKKIVINSPIMSVLNNGLPSNSIPTANIPNN